MADVEKSARSAFASELIRSASAAPIWVVPFRLGGPVARSNRLARQVALVEAVLGEVAGSAEGEAGSAELLEAVRKLLPKLLPALGLDKGEEGGLCTGPWTRVRREEGRTLSVLLYTGRCEMKGDQRVLLDKGEVRRTG